MHEVGVTPAERLAERAIHCGERVVDVAVADREVGPEHDDHARNRLQHRRRRVTLSLELELARLAIGDVGATGDDADDGAVVVEQRSVPPLDHEAPAASVDEGVLVLGRSVPGCRFVKTALDVGTLRRVDEHIPEEQAADLFLVVVAGGLDRRSVLVEDAAVEPDRDEEARSGVGDRLQEQVLGPQRGP